MAAKRMKKSESGKKNPRILIVTPEITYLPEGMGNLAGRMSAKAGGMADVSASLVGALFDLGADVHVALPHYRRMFHEETGKLVADELRLYKSRMSSERIHLAEDRCFYYRDHVYSRGNGNAKLALAFQREVINHVIPEVQPDLIHCNDWMTGLIPAAARRMGIPCLFTVHNIHTHKLTLAQIEDAGIDAAEFWGNLYYERPPFNYFESRDVNPVDLQASGIFAAHFINTVSPTFLKEIVDGWHGFIPDSVRSEIRGKYFAGCAAGILNAPDNSDNPATDPHIPFNYGPADHREAKRKNKLAFQHEMGLTEDADAPIFFWPSRLDPVQKGPQLLTDILYRFLDKYWQDGAQVAIVANGAFQQPFWDILNFHGLQGRLAMHDFDGRTSTDASRSSASPRATSCSCRPSSSPAAFRRCRPRSTVPSPWRTTRADSTTLWSPSTWTSTRATASVSTRTTRTASSGRWTRRWRSGTAPPRCARPRSPASWTSRSTASTTRPARASTSRSTRRCSTARSCATSPAGRREDMVKPLYDCDRNGRVADGEGQLDGALKVYEWTDLKVPAK